MAAVRPGLGVGFLVDGLGVAGRLAVKAKWRCDWLRRVDLALLRWLGEGLAEESADVAGAAPATETRMNSAPARAAAPIRCALPSRSTVAGETPPGPAKPCTAEITVPAPWIAVVRLAGSRTSPRPPPPLTRRGAAPGPGRGSAPGPQTHARRGGGPAACRGCRYPPRRQSRLGAWPSTRRPARRRTAWLTSGPPGCTDSR
jgi:hypothetical protein